jgi:FkbM family methyltransferase
LRTDRFIRKTFFPDFSYRGCMVEVGCATPELLSMSQHFRECGWRCIGIEPNPRFVALHQERGNEVYQYAAADFEADNFDFVVAEASSDYSDHQLSAHSYSSLKIKPEFAEYMGGALSNFKRTNIKVSVRRLDDILKVHCPDVSKIDLLAIDVEGFEIEVMKGFTSHRYTPKVIVLENLFHSSSYTEYMQSIGYRLHSKIKYNYVYVPDPHASGKAVL